MRELRARLGLDSGYLSRLLRSLEEQAGRRRARSRRPATPAGPADGARPARARARRPLRGARAAQLVAPLTRPAAGPADRGAGDRRPAGPRRHRRPAQVDPTDPEARRQWVATSPSWTARFDDRLRPRRGRRPRALAPAPRHVRGGRSDGHPVACGGVQRLGSAPARSSGCGCTATGAAPGSAPGCCADLEDAAGRLGHAGSCLDTNGTLTEAIAMYERAGYRASSATTTTPTRGLVREGAALVGLAGEEHQPSGLRGHYPVPASAQLVDRQQGAGVAVHR